MTEEIEEIWTAEAVTAEMTEEVAAVAIEEAAAAETEEAVAAGREAAVDKAGEVEDLVVVVEVAEAEGPVAAVGEEETN